MTKLSPPGSYDLPKQRRALITALASTLKKTSKFYNEDYENICKAVNKMTMKELSYSIERQLAVAGLSQAEINKHCQAYKVK